MESGEVSMSEVSQIFEIVHAEVSFGFHCREHRYVLYGYLFDPNWDVPNYEMFPERAIITFLSTDMDPAQKNLGTVKVVSEEHALINIFEVTIRLPEHHLSTVREIVMGFDPTLNGLDLTLTYHKDNLPEIDSLGAVEPLHDFDITRRGCPQPHVLKALEEPPAGGWTFRTLEDPDLAFIESKGLHLRLLRER